MHQSDIMDWDFFFPDPIQNVNDSDDGQMRRKKIKLSRFAKNTRSAQSFQKLSCIDGLTFFFLNHVLN